MTNISHKLRRARAAALVALVALALTPTLAGCSSDGVNETSPYTVVSDRADLLTAEPVGEVVLRVSGAIADPNGVAFDLARLEAIGLVEYDAIDEQATGRAASFRGVLVSDLLDAVGADQDATYLHLVALNDYTIDIDIADVERYPVLLATQIDGERMSIAEYGPTRIIFPYHVDEFERAEYDPLWIWQLATIEVG